MSLKNNRFLSGKVIIALLLACLSILLAWSITRATFRDMMGPLNQLSRPDPGIRLVNGLVKDIMQLDQMQRLQSLQDYPKPLDPATEQQMQRIRLSLDSLYNLSRNSAEQLSRIDTMKLLVERRDRIFKRYLRLRYDFIANDTLNEKIKLLSDFLSGAEPRIDQNLITTEQKITTTRQDADTLEESRLTFWDRLFSRKKEPSSREVKRIIQEELKITIDTLAVAQEDSMVLQLSQAITSLEAGRQHKRSALTRERRKLELAGNILIGQLMTILSEMESSAYERIETSNLAATGMINTGLHRFNLILIGFMVLSVMLAILIYSDIAKSNRYKKQLIAARDEAEELSRVKQRFLANMSHELRTPLQAIIGFTEQMKTDHAQLTAANIDIVYQSSQHLLQIVNEVLDYSRITSGRFVLEAHPFSVDEVTRSVCETMGVPARLKGLVLELTMVHEPGSWQLGDAFRLRQILFNIIGNAIKFTQKGRVQVRLQQPQPGLFVFEVSDTGPGIAPADLERIFNPFEQARAAGQQQGSGLGLSICKALVEAQQGYMQLISTPGAGTTCTVSIPYPPATPPVLPAAAAAQATSINGMVWVVDDDATILALCSAILKRHKIAHQCFESAAALLDASLPPAGLNCILSDIRMPGMDGFELLTQLRQRDMGPVRIIALTAQALPDELQALLDRGFNQLLNKPFTEAELLAALRQSPQHQAAAAQLSDAADARIHRLFLEETLKDLDVVKQGLEAQDAPAVAACLHRLAGRCGQFGFRTEARQLRLAEIAVRQNGSVDQQAVEAARALQDLMHRLLGFSGKVLDYPTIY